MLTTNEHDIKLGYTMRNDGVRLRCSCGWQANLGFDCRPATAVGIAGYHAFGIYGDQWPKIDGALDMRPHVASLQRE